LVPAPTLLVNPRQRDLARRDTVHPRHGGQRRPESSARCGVQGPMARRRA
jgi:hypothetical protein